jgi:hypothetical protein
MSEEAAADFAPFNMSMLHYISLSKIIEAKDKAYMDNDLNAWFKGLNRIYIKVVFKLKVEEVETIESGFCKAREYLGAGNRKEASILLFQLDKSLVLLMDKYKMIFPNIKASLGGFDKLKERYGIDE